MKHTLLLILICGFAGPLFGQSEYNYQPRVAGFEYIEVTKGKDDGNLPLLIAFHYSSGNPIETIADYDSLKNPIRIILPKGNYKKRSGFSYYPVDYYKKDSLTQFNLSKIIVDSIARFVQAVQKRYGQRAVISGISQGGDIAFLLARYYPELCKAAFPLAAVIHPNTIQELRSRPAKQVPIYLFQGESDNIVSVVTTRKRIEEIGKRLKIELYTYPDVGHDISSQMKIDYSRLIDAIGNKE